jgi:hypothetical protein
VSSGNMAEFDFEKFCRDEDLKNFDFEAFCREENFDFNEFCDGSEGEVKSSAKLLDIKIIRNKIRRFILDLLKLSNNNKKYENLMEHLKFMDAKIEQLITQIQIIHVKDQRNHQS